MASCAAGAPVQITPSAAQVGIATGLADGVGALDGLGVGESIGVGLADEIALGLGELEGDGLVPPAREAVPHAASVRAAASAKRRNRRRALSTTPTYRQTAALCLWLRLPMAIPSHLTDWPR